MVDNGEPEPVGPASDGDDRTRRVALLGDLRVRTADGLDLHPQVFKTAKTRHLLRLLALQVDRRVPVEVLLEALWPEVPEPRGRASLRTAASLLRRTFAGERLGRVGDALVLHDVEVDVARFCREADLALRSFDDQDAIVGLEHARVALSSYRGNLAEDEPYLAALQAPAAQLALQHQHLLVESAGVALQLGRLHDAVALGERAVEVDSASERACGTLIRALMQLGERAAAFRAYERCCRELAEEFRARPSPPLRRLHDELLVGPGGLAPMAATGDRVAAG